MKYFYFLASLPQPGTQKEDPGYGVALAEPPPPPPFPEGISNERNFSPREYCFEICDISGLFGIMRVKQFERLNANEVHASRDRHHKVSSLIKDLQITGNSVNYELSNIKMANNLSII